MLGLAGIVGQQCLVMVRAVRFEDSRHLSGVFDEASDWFIFKSTFGRTFGSLSFGNVTPQGLSEDFLLGDLAVIGSLAGGRLIGDADLIYVSEPTSVLLLVMGSLALVACRQNVSNLGCDQS